MCIFGLTIITGNYYEPIEFKQTIAKVCSIQIACLSMTGSRGAGRGKEEQSRRNTMPNEQFKVRMGGNKRTR